MEFQEINQQSYNTLHRLMEEYYREGEDEDTPQEEIDGFIRLLFDMVQKAEILGRLVTEEAGVIGFVLWAADTADFAFSECPGLGTILEIGLQKQARASGNGTKIVQYVEQCLRHDGIRQCYVCAYGPAQRFWVHCGYRPSGKNASSGLPILAKEL